MNKRQAARFREARERELHQLASILFNCEVIRSADPLNDAARGCRREPRGNPLQWELSLDALSFNFSDEDIQAQKHAKPPGLLLIDLVLKVKLSGDCREPEPPVNPFNMLSVECVITGGHEDDPGSSYHAAWHLDRHEFANESTGLVHPEYHFQYGGKNLPELKEFGHHVLLDSPRLAHPPLDAVLAIDFVLSNYFPRCRRQLREDSEAYTDIIRNAQCRCWKPYSYAVANYWARVPDKITWSATGIWPQLVPTIRTS